MKVKIDYLKNELKKNKDNFPLISLLILEIPNCDKIAKFFVDEIKVDHVIFFKVKDNGVDNEKSIDFHQTMNNRVEKFMQSVILRLYKSIFEEGSSKSI